MDREVLVPIKRALIVDDSKSARVVLSRVLEKLELAVDTTESAESALTYLRDNRPDVIFMDHVMSGMDGLQAVQAIKSDPSTASIPIMMYTSQDGELYAGEARALGAAGVLPKLMAPADISKVLDQLEILRDPRDLKIIGFEQVHLPAAPAPSAPELATDAPAAAALAAPTAPAGVAATALTATELQAALAPQLREQGAELRRFVVAALETFSGRVVTDVTAQVESAAKRAAEATAAALPPVAPPPPVVVAPAAPVIERRPVLWIAVAACAFVLALASVAYAFQQHHELAGVRARTEAQGIELTALHRELELARAANVATAAAGQRVLVPYGEVPLSGERLATLSRLLGDLEARGEPAAVTVTTATGEFCLTGNPAEGYQPAPGEMPANRCDVVGNPFEEALATAEREPAAALAIALAARSRPPAPVEVSFTRAPRQQSPSGYPVAADVSAAQWNAAAASHNYVEFTVEARHPSP